MIKKTKRDIHKEIMYNKIMPTGHMKRNGFEEYVDENEDNPSPAVSFPEKAEVDPAELDKQLAAEERKAQMAEEERREAKKIDSENDNIVKILSEKEKSEESAPSLAAALEKAMNSESDEANEEPKQQDTPPEPQKNSPAPAEENILPPPEKEDIPKIPEPKQDSETPKEPAPEKPAAAKTEDAPAVEKADISEPPAVTKPLEPLAEPMTAEETEDDTAQAESVIEDILKTVSEKAEKSESIPKPAEIPASKPEPVKAPEPKPVQEKKPAAAAEHINRKTPENIPRTISRPEVPKKPRIPETPKSAAPIRPRIPEKRDNFSVDDILNEIPKNKPVSRPAAKPRLPELVNINEVMINNKIDGILEKFNCCKCPACKLEVIATALNKLSPQYVIKKNENTVPEAIAASNYAKINSALINAIITLRANPIHK